MSFVVTRRLVKEAEKIFRSVGSALPMLRIYREDHPRFVEIIDNLVVLLDGCFKHHETLLRLAFALNNGHAVFQNLPLLDVGMTGERLITTLQDLELKGFQLYRDMSREDLVLFLRNLAHGKRTGGGAGGEVGGENDESEDKNFCFLTKNSTRNLVQAANTRKKLEKIETISLKFHQIPGESFTSLLSTYKVLMTKLELGRALDYDKVADVTDQAVSLFAENDNLNTRKNVASFSYFDDFTYHHSINVCLLTTAVASARTSRRFPPFHPPALLYNESLLNRSLPGFGRGYKYEHRLMKGFLDVHHGSRHRHHRCQGGRVHGRGQTADFRVSGVSDAQPGGRLSGA
jgi:hypothetical protein